MKLLVEATYQFLNNGCKILVEGFGLTLGSSHYLTFKKYTCRAGFIFTGRSSFKHVQINLFCFHINLYYYSYVLIRLVQWSRFAVLENFKQHS